MRLGHGCLGGVEAPFAFRGVSLFTFSLKTFPFNLCLTSGFGKRFIENIVPVGGVSVHVQVPGGATFVGAVRVPGG